MNEWLDFLLEKNGLPAGGERFDQEDADRWRGKLPSGLIELWLEYGLGMWASGKFQFCRPDRYRPVVKMIVQDDPQFQPDETHLFGFGAFGDLLLWNETFQKLQISLPYLQASADCIMPNWTPLPPNIGFISPLSQISDEDSFTLFADSEDPQPIFGACLTRYGQLEPGECYGLFPALALGGSTDIGSVRRVRALEHFAILAQLGPVRLIDYSNGRARFVRDLGAQT